MKKYYLLSLKLLQFFDKKTSASVFTQPIHVLLLCYSVIEIPFLQIKHIFNNVMVKPQLVSCDKILSIQICSNRVSKQQCNMIFIFYYNILVNKHSHRFLCLFYSLVFQYQYPGLPCYHPTDKIYREQNIHSALDKPQHSQRDIHLRQCMMKTLQRAQRCDNYSIH